ncbi:MAG: DNA polymerase II large subunit, partial [Methermicoccaceae archaeon]
KNRAPLRIGARMGRPEKSKSREMKPPPHVLFPLGNVGGRVRQFKKAIEAGGTIDVSVRTMLCPSCNKKVPFPSCPDCGERTVPVGRCSRHGLVGASERCPICGEELVFYDTQTLDLKEMYNHALKSLGEPSPESLKGVIGLISAHKVPERIEKGILRAKHELVVFKDGTIRYDMTDMPLTHFTPNEIGTPVESLRELGYTHDIYGNALTEGEQLLELKVQDIVVSYDCGNHMLRIAAFVDDLLDEFYGMEPYYRLSSRDDLIGQLVIGLAPHTSAGVLGRIIGFTRASVGYAHPFFHAAKRRNCDGDEDCVILLMDALLNFSRWYLPDKRGGKMDAPLVLSTRIDPHDIDSESHNLETSDRYPLEFYLATERFAAPRDVLNYVDIVKKRLGTPTQYNGFGYTHETSDIAVGPENSAYKLLETMMDKMDAQLKLAKKLRCVDEQDVAERILKSHFIPDLLGNLREFSKQGVRCVKCNSKYRRPPLLGVCPKCGGNLVLMVHEGSVRKYLAASMKLADEYGVSDYTKQRIEIIMSDISEVFENYATRQKELFEFM